MGEQDLFLFGVVTGTHGLRGDLKVRPLTGDSSALTDAEVVFLRRPEGGTTEHRPGRIAFHKKHLLLRLEGVEGIDQAQPLVGAEVLMRYDELAELDESEFYWFELQGMKVVDVTLGELGVLEELYETAAHDIYVVRGRFGEVLIPAVDKFVIRIDRETGRMEVDLPEGLIRETE